jgi:flagellar basal body P-ring formation protein FlgA
MTTAQNRKTLGLFAKVFAMRTTTLLLAGLCYAQVQAQGLTFKTVVRPAPTAAQSAGQSTQSADSSRVWVSQENLSKLIALDTLPPGAQVQIDLNRADPRIGSPSCPAALFSNSRGHKMWGRTFLEVQCMGSNTAPFFVGVDVKVFSPVWVSREMISAGEPITPEKLEQKIVDITTLNTGWVSELAHLSQKSAARAIYPGTPLRADLLKGKSLLKRGEQVKVLVTGPGFQIAGSGITLEDAEQGNTVKVKTDKGKVLSGIAKDELLVEITL